LAGVELLPYKLDQNINEISMEIIGILAGLNSMIGQLNDPDGLLYKVLDTDREVYTNLVKSIVSLSGMLDNLDRTTAFFPGQLPQIAGMIADLRVTVKTAEDVLISVANNPLIRGGIPERTETQGGVTSPRNIRF
jgi:phospholipid/cholesterol/gamma-HCH transport system substrate-binding protein